MDDNWKVLLIGGASGTGKTAVAQRLARRFGVSVLLADDIRMALQHLTTAEQNPALHAFAGHGEIWDHSADALCSGWIGVSQVVSKALEAVIAHHLSVESVGPIIIEGDCVDPRLATLEQYAWYPGGEGVKSVVLYEPEDTMLLGNMRRRGRGFGEGSFQEQITYARGASWFGRWLKQEAEGCGIPVLTSRPWETLEERILEAVGCPVESEQHPA